MTDYIAIVGGPVGPGRCGTCRRRPGDRDSHDGDTTRSPPSPSAASTRHFGTVARRRRRRPRRSRRRVLRHARAVRLGQDDLPAPDRRLRAADRRPRSTCSARPSAGVPPYRRPVNTVFQDYALFPHMNVLDNVCYGLMIRRRGRGPSASALGREALALVKLAGLEARQAGGSSPAASASASRSPARWSSGPRCCSSTSRSARSTSSCARRCRASSRALQRDARHHLRLRHPRPGRGAVDGRPRRRLQRGPASSRSARPEEVYERPRTRFVADFVGGSNVIAAGHRRALDRPVAAGEPPAGEDRRARRRRRDAAPDAIAVAGTVDEVLYHGADAAHRSARPTIGPPDGAPCRPARRLPVHEGEAVRAAFPRDALHLMDGLT